MRDPENYYACYTVQALLGYLEGFEDAQAQAAIAKATKGEKDHEHHD